MSEQIKSEQIKKDIRQLRKLDFDLANYFSNTIIPQLFVDADMVLRIFTPPAMKQFSLSHDDIGKHIEDVQDNIRYPTMVENIEEVIFTSEIFEKEIQTTDGNWFQMNILPYVEHENNNINGVIITFVDITKRLNMIKELERINSEHQVLMFALAHDVRQPISTFKLISTGLLETFNRHDKEKFSLLLNRFQITTNSLSSLIDEFTADGEENLRHNEEEKLLDIEEICLNILNSLRNETGRYNIRILKDFKASKIEFPKKKLRSIIYNILQNAIKYRHSDRASIIQISTYNTEGYTVFSVEDNGLGIAKEHQKKVFEKSLRLNKEIDGTGMGLYIIKRMIQLHGGKIELQSTLGKGSKFQVFFKKTGD